MGTLMSLVGAGIGYGFVFFVVLWFQKKRFDGGVGE